MPVFKQQSIEKKKPGRPAGIPQEVVDEYKQYIEQLEKGSEGILEFKKDENINQARKALQQAGEELKKYVKVRKQRGSDNALKFQQITRKEWVEAKQKAKARGAKLKGKPKAKKATAKTKVKPKAKKKS